MSDIQCSVKQRKLPLYPPVEATMFKSNINTGDLRPAQQNQRFFLLMHGISYILDFSCFFRTTSNISDLRKAVPTAQAEEQVKIIQHDIQ